MKIIKFLRNILLAIGITAISIPISIMLAPIITVMIVYQIMLGVIEDFKDIFKEDEI